MTALDQAEAQRLYALEVEHKQLITKHQVLVRASQVSVQRDPSLPLTNCVGRKRGEMRSELTPLYLSLCIAAPNGPAHESVGERPGPRKARGCNPGAEACCR